MYQKWSWDRIWTQTLWQRNRDRMVRYTLVVFGALFIYRGFWCTYRGFVQMSALSLSSLGFKNTCLWILEISWRFQFADDKYYIFVTIGTFVSFVTFVTISRISLNFLKSNLLQLGTLATTKFCNFNILYKVHLVRFCNIFTFLPSVFKFSNV